jgi:creatinine amidohydrolase
MLHTHYWTELAWPDFEALDTSRLIAVLPLAAVEQHGPHLPLGGGRAGALSAHPVDRQVR